MLLISLGILYNMNFDIVKVKVHIHCLVDSKTIDTEQTGLAWIKQKTIFKKRVDNNRRWTSDAKFQTLCHPLICCWSWEHFYCSYEQCLGAQSSYGGIVFDFHIMGRCHHWKLWGTEWRKGIEIVLFLWFQGPVLYPTYSTGWRQHDLSKQCV